MEFTKQPLKPSEMPTPFANYAHGIAIPAGYRMVQTSGQLRVMADGRVPESALAQAHLCAHVTDCAHMASYMQARDAFTGQAPTLPASTLLIVSGFTRPEFLVEVEALAAAPA